MALNNHFRPYDTINLFSIILIYILENNINLINDIMTKQDKSPDSNFSRRLFVKGSSLAAAGFMIVPRHVLGGTGFISPSDKVNIAGIGAGGKGFSDLNEMWNRGKENIVAMADVDEVRASRAFKKWDKATKYKDFRKMLEKEKGIDAVTISTPDNTHAVAAIAAMELGKHVYVQKPLTHDIFEARALTEAARKYKVITQMGNQGASGEGTQQVQEWIDSGILGEITKVHAWTNRPIWPQGIPTPTGNFEIPSTLDWNLWLGPAPKREFHPNYLPFKWRGWWDFGTGALGDMAAHIIDPAFRALRLGHPTAVEASVVNNYINDFQEENNPESCPAAAKIVYDFPEKDGRAALKLIWYDGGLRPDRPDELGPDEEMGNWDGGLIFEGSKGKLMCDCYGENPRLLPLSKNKEVDKPEEKYRRIKEGHYQNWIKAIKGEVEETVSNFDIAGPLTETILIGNLALRSHNVQVLKAGKKLGDWNPFLNPGRKKLIWDSEKMKVTNFDAANEFVKRKYRSF